VITAILGAERYSECAAGSYEAYLSLGPTSSFGESLSAVVDWVGVAEVLILGETIGDDLPIPGHRLPRAVPRLDVPPPVETFAGSAAEAMHTCDALIRDVISAAPADWEFDLGLSGGRDSRHLLLAAQATGRRIAGCVTAQHWNPDSSNADVQAAGMLAHALDLSVDVVPQVGDRFLAQWNKNRILGLRTRNHSWVLPMAAHLGARRPLIDGVNGGNMFGRDSLTMSWLSKNGFTRPTPEQAVDHVIQQKFTTARRRMKGWLTSPRLSREIWQETRQRIVDRFTRYLDYPNPFQAWSCLEHTANGIALAPYVLMDNDRVLCPYFDPTVVTFGLSLPWEISANPDFQQQMLTDIYPKVAHIPYSHEIRQAAPPLQFDAVSEAQSWAHILHEVSGHVHESAFNAEGPRPDGIHGNRRLVLLAQALRWERQGRPSDLWLEQSNV
jgi:asparagine synthase (glutamine-hydrolysing)